MREEWKVQVSNIASAALVTQPNGLVVRVIYEGAGKPLHLTRWGFQTTQPAVVIGILPFPPDVTYLLDRHFTRMFELPCALRQRYLDLCFSHGPTSVYVRPGRVNSFAQDSCCLAETRSHSGGCIVCGSPCL